MLLGLIASLAIVGLFFAHNWRRSRLQIVQELKPNCLLTSSPLVFVTGKRSLFYFLAYWNQIPHYLASHGYDVYHLNLPWLNEAKRRRHLHSFLSEQSQKQGRIHLFIDEGSLREMVSLLKDRDYDCLASVNLLAENGKTPPFRLNVPIAEVELPENKDITTPLFWKLHRTWTFQRSRRGLEHLGWQMQESQGHVLLDRVQFLAERDLLQGRSSPTLEA